MTRTRIALVLAVGAACGWLLWWCAPLVAGPGHPLDSWAVYYDAAVAISGFVAALAYPRRFGLAALAVCIGQLAYQGTHMGGGAFWLAGLFITVEYSVLALLGAFGTFILNFAVQRVLISTPKPIA